MDGKKAARGLVCLVLTGCLGSCVSTPPSPPSIPPPVVTSPPDEGPGIGGSPLGLSQQERQLFYHLPQGNELLWLSVLRALPSRKALEGRVAGFQSFLDEPERFGFLPDPDSREGLPVGLALVPATERQPVARVGVNCAACHVGEFHYQGRKVRVDGAPSLLSMEDFNREAVEVLSRTLLDRRQLLEFLQRLAVTLPTQPRGGGLQEAYPDTDLTPDGDSSAQEKLVAEVEWYCEVQGQCRPPVLGPEPERVREFDQQLTQYVHELSRKQVRTVPDAIRVLRGHLLYFMRLGKLKFGTYSGPGRVDAFGVARGVLFGPEAAGVLVAPVSFPCLWEFQHQTWLHWDGNTNSMMERNIGQALGTGAPVDPRTFASSVLPRNLAMLEKLSRKIESPRWPEELLGRLDQARIERGREHYARHCESCHEASPGVVPLEQVGTDGNRARSFAAKVGDLEFPAALKDLIARVKQRAYAREGLSEPESRQLDPEVIYWRAPMGYVARPMAGIWATPPYLHNGSVPTLWDLLQPASARPARFPLGHAEYDPVKVGYTTELSSTPRFTFDVAKPGNGNAGHEYGTDLSDEEKYDLLEYLKSR
jgi:hypothetical protein